MSKKFHFKIILLLLFLIPSPSIANSNTDYIEQYEQKIQDLRALESSERKVETRNFVASDLAKKIKSDLKLNYKNGNSQAAYLLYYACTHHSCLEDNILNSSSSNFSKSDWEEYFLVYSEFDKKSRDLLKEAANRKEPRASLIYAINVLDVQKQTGSLEKNTMGFYSYKYSETEKTRMKRYAGVMRWLSELKWEKQGEAQFWYSQLFYGFTYEATEIAKDNIRKQYWLERSAENGYVSAINHIIHENTSIISSRDKENVNLEKALNYLLRLKKHFESNGNLNALNYVNNRTAYFYANCLGTSKNLDLAYSLNPNVEINKSSIVFGHAIYCKSTISLAKSLIKNTTLKYKKSSGIFTYFDSSTYLEGTTELILYSNSHGILSVAEYKFKDGISEKQYNEIYMDLLRNYGEPKKHDIYFDTKKWILSDGLEIILFSNRLELSYPILALNLLNKIDNK